MRPAYLVLIGLFAIGAGALGWVLAGPRSQTVQVESSSAPMQPAEPIAWRELLGQRRFDELDQRLTALQANVEAGRCQECAATAPYYELSTSDPISGDRLDEWIKARPDSVPAHMARGMYRKHIASLARGGAYAAETHPQRFAEMTRLQKGAAEDLTWVVRHNARMPLAYSELIGIATSKGDDTAAGEIYDEGIARNPGSPAIYRAHAWSLSPWWRGALPPWLARYRLELYIAYLDLRFGGRPGFGWLDGYADYIEGETLARTGDTDGAIAYYTEAIAAAEYPSYLIARAGAYSRKYKYGRIEEQQADLMRALEIAPRNDDALFEMGRLKIELCRQAKAAKSSDLAVCQAAADALDRAVKEDPLDPDHLTWRALQLAEAGRVEDARHDLEQARVYGEYDPFLQSLAGDVLASFDHAAAKEAYQRAVALTPDEPKYLGNYLRFLMRTGDCEFFEAYSSYKRMCENDDSCGQMTNPPDAELQFFQERRGRSCAVETWHEPRTSLILPD